MFSTIYIYETDFQQSIINHIVTNHYFDNSKMLIIDARKHQIKINDNVYTINFNQINLLKKSLISIEKLKKEKLICKTLVSVHITGINALFLSSFIKTKSKILIDDGIGTPVLVDNPNLFQKRFKYQLRFLITKICLASLGYQLNNVEQTLKTIDIYYTVYNKSIQYNNFKTINLENFFNGEYFVLKNKVCFIGAPLIEFKLTKVEEIQILLLNIKYRFGDYIYYLHPDEYILLKYKIEGVTFKKLNVTVEKYFHINGIPEITIGYTSSALLNLSAQICPKNKLKILYVKSKIYGNYFDNKYYQILEKNNIRYSGLTL